MSIVQASQSYPNPPVGRKRTVNHDLPPRMARKGESYYYVSNEPRKWTPLGSDLAAAKRKWAELESVGPPVGLTVADLCQRYIERNRDALALGSIQQYQCYVRTIGGDLGIPASQLTSRHVALWRDLPGQLVRRTYVNGCLALLRASFALGAEQGLCEPLTVAGNTLKRRDRYITDDEYRAIRERAPEWLQIAMDLGYLTASRRSDLLALRWDALSTTHLTMRQQKTKQRIAFEMTPDMSSLLARARQRRVLGLTVIARASGRPVTDNMMDEHWRAACKAAGVEDAHFHDIRGKAATDAAGDGQDYQKLLGHASKRMSDRYVKIRGTVVAEPVKRKI